MDTNNIVLNLPFDESNGSSKAYDYSQSRADAVVSGAKFVQGKNGNAISFGGNDTCEVEKSILPNLNEAFSLLAWVQSKTADVGSPTQFIIVLAFEGVNNYVEIPIDSTPGSWYSLCLTRYGSTFNVYVNAQLIKTINNGGTLTGVSVNQDYYGGEYGFGLLDDVKIYNIALTQAEITEELSTSKQQAYTIDGVDLKEYGVYVSASEGVLSKPKLKTPASISWDNYHGESVDLMHKFYEAREITLSCFIKAENKMEFIKRISEFEAIFDKKGTNRLVVDVHPIKPLIYEVYAKDAIEITKTWSEQLMVGTFKLKLVEPEPVKRVLKHIRINDSTADCTIKLTSTKYVNVYWGDGSVSYDVAGTEQTITHTYETNGDYFPVITGCVEEITDFDTNAIVVWERI